MSPNVERNNIFLTGMMGTGKSSAGKILAAMLAFEFVDTDKSIEREQRSTVADIFRIHGEPYFRAQERDLLQRCCRSDRQVIATGGGMLGSTENLELAQSSGLVVLLTADLDVLVQRVAHRSTRPLLAGGDPGQRLAAIGEQRREVYAGITSRIDTTRLSPHSTALEVAEAFRRWKGQT